MDGCVPLTRLAKMYRKRSSLSEENMSVYLYSIESVFFMPDGTKLFNTNFSPSRSIFQLNENPGSISFAANKSQVNDALPISSSEKVYAPILKV